MRPINWPHAPNTTEKPILMLAEYGDYSLSMESINHNADRYLEGGETQPQQFERYLRRKLSYEIDFIDSRRAESWNFSLFQGRKKDSSRGGEFTSYELIFDADHDSEVYGEIFHESGNNFVGGIFAEIGVLLSKIWEEEWMFTGYTQGNQSYEIVIQKHGEGLLG